MKRFAVESHRTIEGSALIVWRCVTRVSSECDAPAILKTDVEAVVVKAIHLVLGDHDRMVQVLQENIETVLQFKHKIKLFFVCRFFREE